MILNKKTIKVLTVIYSYLIELSVSFDKIISQNKFRSDSPTGSETIRLIYFFRI